MWFILNLVDTRERDKEKDVSICSWREENQFAFELGAAEQGTLFLFAPGMLFWVTLIIAKGFRSWEQGQTNVLGHHNMDKT